MAKGSPDFYRGSVLYGMFGGSPKELSVDSAGNLAAFLKAYYGLEPTALQCDEDGNLKIAIELQASDLTVDIAAQSLSFLHTEPYSGTTADFYITHTFADDEMELRTILTGAYYLWGFSMEITGDGDLANAKFQIVMDGTTYDFIAPSEEWLQESLDTPSGILKGAAFYPIAKRIIITLTKPLYIKTSLACRVDNVSGDVVTFTWKGVTTAI
jgi:hypothetical protein